MITLLNLQALLWIHILCQGCSFSADGSEKKFDELELKDYYNRKLAEIGLGNLAETVSLVACFGDDIEKFNEFFAHLSTTPFCERHCYAKNFLHKQRSTRKFLEYSEKLQNIKTSASIKRRIEKLTSAEAMSMMEVCNIDQNFEGYLRKRFYSKISARTSDRFRRLPSDESQQAIEKFEFAADVEKSVNSFLDEKLETMIFNRYGDESLTTAFNSLPKEKKHDITFHFRPPWETYNPEVDFLGELYYIPSVKYVRYTINGWLKENMAAIKENLDSELKHTILKLEPAEERSLFLQKWVSTEEVEKYLRHGRNEAAEILQGNGDEAFKQSVIALLRNGTISSVEHAYFLEKWEEDKTVAKEYIKYVTDWKA